MVEDLDNIEYGVGAVLVVHRCGRVRMLHWIARLMTSLYGLSERVMRYLDTRSVPRLMETTMHVKAVIVFPCPKFARHFYQFVRQNKGCPLSVSDTREIDAENRFERIYNFSRARHPLHFSLPHELFHSSLGLFQEPFGLI